MELAQSVDVDRAVIHPDGLADSGRLPEAKEGLVDQIKYVAHFPKFHFVVTDIDAAFAVHRQRIASAPISFALQIVGAIRLFG